MTRRALGGALPRFALVLTFAAAATGAAGALSIGIAPLAIVGEALREGNESPRPERDLRSALGDTPLRGSLSFSLVEASEPAPLSFLDAAGLCERRGYPYLLYGYLRRREASCQAELKLLSREGKRILASFFSSDDTGHYERLIADLSGKVADYFLSDLAIVPGEPAPEPRRNLFEIPLAAGWWTSGGRWGEAAMGILCADVGLRFIPRKPVAGLKPRHYYTALCLECEYALGLSRPGLETASLHRIQVRLPLELFLELGDGNGFGLALGGLAEFSILRQERKYGGSIQETGSAGGILASLAYRRALSERLSLGLELEYDLIFYEQPLATMSPRILLEYSLAKRSGGSD